MRRLLLIGCTLLCGLALTLTELPDRGPGEIHGTVVNVSQGATPCAGVEVMLRVKQGNQFVLAAEAIADAQGRYRFDNLMSRGTPVMVGMLFLLSLIVIVLAAAIISGLIPGPSPPNTRTDCLGSCTEQTLTAPGMLSTATMTLSLMAVKNSSIVA